MRYRSVALGFVIALSPVGCGTVNNLTRPLPPTKADLEKPGPSVPLGVWNDDAQKSSRQVYGGVRGEWAELKALRWNDEYSFLNPIAIALYAIDLPLTLVGDTLTLPYTVPA